MTRRGNTVDTTVSDILSGMRTLCRSVIIIVSDVRTICARYAVICVMLLKTCPCPLRCAVTIDRGCSRLCPACCCQTLRVVLAGSWHTPCPLRYTACTRSLWHTGGTTESVLTADRTSIVVQVTTVVMRPGTFSPDTYALVGQCHRGHAASLIGSADHQRLGATAMLDL